MKDLMALMPTDLMKRSIANGQHPRTLVVATANAAIGVALAQIEKKYNLTSYEVVKCLSDYMSLSMKYALRVERHGDPEYPADAAPATRRRRGKIAHRNGGPPDCRRANLRVRS
jgi:hypothetical protein